MRKVNSSRLRSNNKRPSELEKMQEWQEKMYLPGYYVGGKIEPYLQARSKIAGYGFLAMGFFYLLSALGLFLFADRTDGFTFVNIISALFLSFGPALILIIGGIRTLKNLRKNKT